MGCRWGFLGELGLTCSRWINWSLLTWDCHNKKTNYNFNIILSSVVGKNIGIGKNSLKFKVSFREEIHKKLWQITYLQWKFMKIQGWLFAILSGNSRSYEWIFAVIMMVLFSFLGAFLSKKQRVYWGRWHFEVAMRLNETRIETCL